MAVRLRHPDSQTVVEVSESRAEVLKGRGYTVEDVTDVPNVSDKKSAWVDYAVGRGLDRNEAEELTKDELVERYG